MFEVENMLVAPGGFEPPISWLRTRCPSPLDDGATQPTHIIQYPLAFCQIERKPHSVMVLMSVQVGVHCVSVRVQVLMQ